MVTAEIRTTGFDALIGLEYVEASGDRVVARFDIGPRLHQPYGITHGGVYCSVVESTASVGAALWYGEWYGERGQVVGVANHTNFLRATKDGRLTAVATPIHRGRTQQLWLVEITDDGGRMIARGEVRLANIEGGGVAGRPS
jgi:uncharacterized protein (TIGR00369 family)